eukprot:357655-Chlamydomonas_euryale.AAC.3
MVACANVHIVRVKDVPRSIVTGAQRICSKTTWSIAGSTRVWLVRDEQPQRRPHSGNVTSLSKELLGSRAAPNLIHRPFPDLGCSDFTLLAAHPATKPVTAYQHSRRRLYGKHRQNASA